MIAADYDGTWTNHQELEGHVDFIITGNTWKDYTHVMEKASNIPVYFNPGENKLMDIVGHKVNVINKTGVSRYYENEPSQVAMLKIMCPKAKIIQVTERIIQI